MYQYKTFALRVGLIGISNLVLSLSSIIFLPILTKNLSIEQYGIWVQLMATVGIIPLVVLLGLPYTMSRFLSVLEKKEEIQEIFYSFFFVVTITSAIASTLIYIFSNLIATKLFGSDLIIVKILCFIVFIECLNSFFFSYLRATQQIKKYSLLFLMQTLLNIILVSFFVITGRNILGATVGFILKEIIIFLTLSLITISEIGFIIPKFLNLKKYLGFGLPTISSNLSSWIVDSSDRYIIGIFLGISSVGLYSPGYTLGNVINMFFAPLSFILPPVLSVYYDKNNFDEVRTMLSYSMKYFALMAIPSAFGLSLLSKPILMLLATPEIAFEGYLITPFTALSSLLFGFYGIISHIFVLEKRTKLIGKIWLTSAILNLILNFLLVPRIGLLGAAIATLIAYAFSFIVSWQYCSKSLVFDMKIKFITKSIFSSILMSLIIVGIRPEGLYSILLTTGICAVFYGVTMILLKGFEKREFDFLTSIIKV